MSVEESRVEIQLYGNAKATGDAEGDTANDEAC